MNVMISELASYYYGKHRARREMGPRDWRPLDRREAALGRMVGVLLIVFLVIALLAGIFGHQQ